MKVFDTLAPVGSRITLNSSGRMDWQAIYTGYSVQFMQSGTAALAAAMLSAKANAADSYRREVILPAYGCPDLVSAAVYAGFVPVLVDIEPGRPQISLGALSQCISSNTLAVVAVNFLGLPERLSALRDICQQNGSYLIEDSAQSFPQLGSDLYGDYVITSFGRGKPVSLLGGGMLLTREGLSAKRVEVADVGHSSRNSCRYSAKVMAYNTLLSPRCYGLLELLPFLSLGETRYKPLQVIETLPAYMQGLLPANIKKYLARDLNIQKLISSTLAQYDFLVDLAASAEQIDLKSNRLLRYPVLLDNAANRDSLLEGLNRQGLGATAMYRKCLPDIEGVGELVTLVNDIPNAEDFAKRLMTLPVHELVEEGHVEMMEEIFAGGHCGVPY